MLASGCMGDMRAVSHLHVVRSCCSRWVPCAVRWPEVVEGHLLPLVTADRQGTAEPRGWTEEEREKGVSIYLKDGEEEMKTAAVRRPKGVQ